MNNKTAYTADRIFTGTDMLHNHALVVADGRIENIVPAISLEESMNRKDFGDKLITAPFIDLQVYGAGGRLLAEYPDAQSLQTLQEHGRKHGTAYCLPTVATNRYGVFFKCVDAVRTYWNAGGKGILGLHIEGPWINPLRRGAHAEECIFSPTLEQVYELLDYGQGVIRMITLAPEVCAEEVIEAVTSRGIVVSLGHSNAGYDQAMQALNRGVPAITHLYNAMSPLHHRAPGIVGAAFDHPVARASIVADGFHVDFAAIRIAKKLMGDRLFAITDAVTDTDTGYYPHKRNGDKYESNGILSGSALTMNKAARNLCQFADVPLEEAIRMCSLYPAKVLNLGDHLGSLHIGYPAEFSVFDGELNCMSLIENE